MLRLLCLVMTVSILVSDVRATTVDSCTNPKDPISVRITDCDKLPCQLVSGSKVEAEVEFEVGTDSETLRPKVVVSALGLSNIRYPLPQQDACQALTNAECPLDKGEQIIYKLEMPIDTSYPTIAMSVELSLVGDNDNVLTCFQFRGQIIKPSV